MRTLIMLMAVLCSTGLAWSQPPQYKLIDLGPVMALDVSESGQVVGIDTRAQQAARLRPSGAQLLPNLEGGYFSRATGSNLWAQVVGYSSAGAHGLHTHAVVWDRNGDPEDLGTLGGENLFSAATATSLTATITGYADAAVGEAVVPVAWVGRIIMELPTLGGAAGFADDVNDYGVIVGESQDQDGEWHATLWDVDGIAQNLQPAALSGSSRARDINRYGVVVGEGVTAGMRYAFRWSARDGFQALPPAAGDVASAAAGVNAAGVVVGISIGQGNDFFATAQRAVMWHRGSVYVLSDLITNLPGGWQLTNAVGISRGGSIAGTGTYNGQRRSWLLVPCAGRKCA